MTLRLRINLIVGALTLLFLAAVIGLQLRGMRDSVNEEVVAANRVATQLLDRTAWRYAGQGSAAMLGFLQSVGRVRANDILLFDSADRELYRSPPSPYKAGRDAPQWFNQLVSPAPSIRAIRFPDGRLEVHANASRAVLDAWDELLWLAASGLALLVLLNALVFWGVGRAVRPLGRIVGALDAMQAGQLDVQLPPLPGKEAAAIGSAFNRMTAQLGAHIATERRAAQAELQLSDSRALTHWLEQHIEDERRLIARELHDELGQSVTAMRSMALSIAQRSSAGHPAHDAGNEQAARLIAEEAGRLYDAMHGIIPRLAPLVLDSFGLADALADLVERTHRSQPGAHVQMQLALDGAQPNPEAALALYRAAQEGITNALRHGQANQITLHLTADAHHLTLEVRDNGSGPAPSTDAGENGHFGLRWLEERARALGGTVQLQGRSPQGATLTMRLLRQRAVAAAVAPHPATGPGQSPAMPPSPPVPTPTPAALNPRPAP